ncbi:hypothetical protein F5Y19DRAFT_488603 [Xylariaceae sp. FL1651]|nr:hypothetical protein F5Y19DRAFT_488603 [Xylariaceae sp. FL1651]
MAGTADDTEFVVVEHEEAPNAQSRSHVRSTSTSRAGPQSVEIEQSDLGYLLYKLAKKGRKIQILVPLLEIDTGVSLHASKTIGLITAKDENKVLMTAQSGWSTGQQRDQRCLDTARWNSLALHHLAAQLNFHFPGNQRDNGSLRALDEHRGRAHAGHVEVLLACWYAVDTLRKTFDLANASDEWLVTQLRRLKKGANLGTRRTAIITIDSQACRTCLQFLTKLTQHTGIIFSVVESAGVGPTNVRVRGERRHDTIGAYFADSGSDAESPGPAEKPFEAIQIGETAAEDVASTTTQEPNPRTPYSTPHRSHWPKQKPAPWTPDNPEEHLSRYKKATPVWQWPGYEGSREPAKRTPPASTQNGVDIVLTAPIHVDPTVDADCTTAAPESMLVNEEMSGSDDCWEAETPCHRPKTSLRLGLVNDTSKQSATTIQKAIKNRSLWEDLGDGLFFSREGDKSGGGERSDANHPKEDDRCLSSTKRGSTHEEKVGRSVLASSNGFNYALAAFEATREPERGVLRQEIDQKAYRTRDYVAPRAIQQSYAHRLKVFSPVNPKRGPEPAQQRAPDYFPLASAASSSSTRLQGFRHIPAADDSAESVLKSRYSILRTRDRY